MIKDIQDPIASIAHSTYSNLIGALSNGSLFYNRVVLTPTNDIVTRVNDYVLSIFSLIHDEKKVYLSSDSISKTNGFVNNRNDALMHYQLNF